MSMYNRNRGSSDKMAGGSNYLEQENNEMTEKLLTKTSALKEVNFIINCSDQLQLSIQIGDEVRSQNRLADDMHGDFDSSADILSATMRRLGIVSKSGGPRFMCYLVMFCLFVFFVIYWLISKR